MVPASSANLGSGFDSIGLCLDLWNAIEFHKSKFKIIISGEGKETIKESLTYAFHNQTAAMHTAHHPEIEVLSENEATGKWYLQDIFYNFRSSCNTF